MTPTCTKWACVVVVTRTTRTIRCTPARATDSSAVLEGVCSPWCWNRGGGRYFSTPVLIHGIYLVEWHESVTRTTTLAHVHALVSVSFWESGWTREGGRSGTRAVSCHMLGCDLKRKHLVPVTLGPPAGSARWRWKHWSFFWRDVTISDLNHRAQVFNRLFDSLRDLLYSYFLKCAKCVYNKLLHIFT